MKKVYLLAAAAAFVLSACGEEATKPAAKPEVVLDPKVVAINAATTLAELETLCNGLPAYPSGSTRDLTKACSPKLTEAIKREKIPDFESGLRYFKDQLEPDGKAETILAVAAQQALTSWLREMVRSADAPTLQRWRKQLPEKRDQDYTFETMRTIINGGLRPA